MDRYVMISSDCHAGLPWTGYRNYLDPQFREDWDRWVTSQAGTHLTPSRSELAKVKPFQFGSMPAERQKQYLEEMEKSFGHLGNWDPDVRVRELDREGIAGEIVFCDGSQNNHPPFGVGFLFSHSNATAEERLAGCRAHNRWLAELCATNPGRHAGIALVTMDDIEVTVEEIRWARKNGLFGGILLPALRFHTDGPELFWNHPRYEPVWSVCEELDMPLNTHATGTGIDHGGAIFGRIENYFTSYRPFWFLLSGGVFERHPRLQLVVTESGGMEVLWFTAYLDYLATYRNPEGVRKIISMKPSEYWHRQCYVGASAHSERQEIDARYQIGVKNLLWGSDYPHPEGTWPVSMERTKKLFAGVPEDEVRLMIGENAARVYKFDMGKMRKIAERIGPKVSELSGSSAAAPKTS